MDALADPASFKRTFKLQLLMKLEDFRLFFLRAIWQLFIHGTRKCAYFFCGIKDVTIVANL
jgi:hypothetical protein